MKKHILFLALTSCNFVGTIAVSSLQTTVELGWATAPSGPFGLFNLEEARGVAIASDGSIILAGRHNVPDGPPSFDLAALQLIPNLSGGVDLGWATSIHEPFGLANADEANALIIATDGSIILAGTHFPAGPDPARFAALQLIPTGSTVSLGWVTAPLAPFGTSIVDFGRGATLDMNGNIILAGLHVPGPAGSARFAALQLIPNMSGGVDLGWATAISEPFGPSEEDVATSVAIDSDHNIILAGGHTPLGVLSTRFAALQLIPNASGGVNLGWATAPSGPYGNGNIAIANGVAVGEGGNAILAGFHQPVGGLVNQFAALQLIPNMSGGVDLGWATAISGPFGPSGSDTALGVAIDVNGAIILAGVHNPPDPFTPDEFAALQLIQDNVGNIALGWSTAINKPFGSADFDTANALVIETNVNIILAGVHNPSGPATNRFAALQLIQKTLPQQRAKALALPFVILAAT